MLNAHFDSVEKMILARSQIAANSGHTLHKGTPRELFVREFLQTHLGHFASFGTGEIIDQDSRPGQDRNQVDIVIYKSGYPKLDFGGGISAFLAESVIATIEVKSVLDEAAVAQAVKTAKAIKSLKRNFHSFEAGHRPPPILSYVVGYTGPVNMATVHGWFDGIHQAAGVTFDPMPLTLQERSTVRCPTIDGVFLLGKGFIQFDNAAITFLHDDARAKNPLHKWSIVDAKTGALFVLSLLLTQAVSRPPTSWLDPFPYVSHVNMPIPASGL